MPGIDNSLDFLRLASVTGHVMTDNDARQKMLADLTALFEDAAGLASEGQKPVQSASQARSIAQEIRKLLRNATKTLDELN